MLRIEDMTFQRNDSGELLAQEVELNLPDKPRVKIKPLTKGQLGGITTKAQSSDINVKLQADFDVIKLGLVEPKLEEKDIEALKPEFSNAISFAILSASTGKSEDELLTEGKKFVDKEDKKKQS